MALPGPATCRRPGTLPADLCRSSSQGYREVDRARAGEIGIDSWERVTERTRETRRLVI